MRRDGDLPSESKEMEDVEEGAIMVREMWESNDARNLEILGEGVVRWRNMLCWVIAGSIAEAVGLSKRIWGNGNVRAAKTKSS